ncbi:ABC transporter ATP-binding protein [Variovorax sp. Sphag1AA]|uniref:ABC transporter ATP-binding protein n=1 Tax=Variovorax sp. Sphag1AA TaxID=2587027 RepID=UPI00161582BC|nr:ABC transporter ATP-binding protein [Variovorax sp. Sphag1AA]MBB3181445.1 sulfonate transport system ATP-binding protein [Variovorax sp. Sphag1AA]
MNASTQSRAKAAVTARGVGRSFDGRTVLRDIHLTIEPGEFLAIVGKSGCGKSTLLRAIGGLDAGYTGDLHVDGTVAFGFQDARLLPWARVWENVVFGLGGPRPLLRTQALEALAAVDLAGHADAWPRTLSGGEAQRAALARSLIREPAVLLLDEPFGALDALTRLRMHALVNGLWRNKGFAVVLVTHDVEEAVLLADRVAVLDNGRVADLFAVDLPRPRARIDERFEAARQRILADLGVLELDAVVSAHERTS